MLVIKLPWPPSELLPNKKLHWSIKARHTKSYRSICRALARQASSQRRHQLGTGGKIILSITFYPPDRRKRDDDGMLASFKAGRDGIADALDVDDVRFSTRLEVGEPVRDGSVTVALWEQDA